jgi:hypothetical protein
MSLPLHLRAYTEKTKDELARDFFNAPFPDQLPAPSEPPVSVKPARGAKGANGSAAGLQNMDINAVLSVEGKEDVYVSRAAYAGVSPRACTRARFLFSSRCS